MTDLDPVLKVVVVGHVDDGKSTLIGRLLHETDSLPDNKLEEIQKQCDARGMIFEWSFLLDAFQAERDQAVTIDTAQVPITINQMPVTLIDAPGHIEFLKNMVSGAANADTALLVIDAKEGVRNQTKMHSYLLHLLGIHQIAVVINKMDLVDYSEARFLNVKTEVEQYLSEVGITPSIVIPISARNGDVIKDSCDLLNWYQGPSVIEAFRLFKAILHIENQPLRFQVQDIYKFDERRIIAGRLQSGTLRTGDKIIFSPSNKTGTIASIESWNMPVQIEAKTGQSIGITLKEECFIERGELISHDKQAPPLTTVCKITVFWLADSELQHNHHYQLRLGTQTYDIKIEAVINQINTDTLEKHEASTISRNQCGEVVIHCDNQIAMDEYHLLPKTGRCVLLSNNMIVAGGLLSMSGFPDQRKTKIVQPRNVYAVAHKVKHRERFIRNGHMGAVIWLTGLSCSGKSTIATEAEKVLFNHGYQVYLLDGDNLRSGVNSDLGFGPEERSENIRRAGEISALFADAGMICLSALISPYDADRQVLRKKLGNRFHEIYIEADLATCEARDTKGFYQRARKGEITEFTGINSPYEIPEDAELTINTCQHNIQECVQQLIVYIENIAVLQLEKKKIRRSRISRRIKLYDRP